MIPKKGQTDTGPRVVAICLLMHENRILVSRGHDSASGEDFVRPLGGGVSFGETGAETVAREIKEETNEEVEHIRYLGAFENLFNYAGRPGHEIVLVYDAKFKDDTAYLSTLFALDDERRRRETTWIDPSPPAGRLPTVYPTGLLEFLRER